MTDPINVSKEELIPGARPPLPHNPIQPIPVEQEVAASQPIPQTTEQTEEMPDATIPKIPDVVQNPETLAPTPEPEAKPAESLPDTINQPAPTSQIAQVEQKIKAVPEEPVGSLVSPQEVASLVGGDPNILKAMAGKGSPAEGASKLVEEFQGVRQEYHDDNPINPVQDEEVPVNVQATPATITETEPQVIPPTPQLGETTENNPNSNQQ